MKNLRKAFVAVAGLAAQALNQGLVPDRYQALVAAAAGLVTAVLVYWVPNEPKTEAAHVAGH